MRTEDEIRRVQRPEPREVQCREYLGVGSIRDSYGDAGRLRSELAAAHAEIESLRAELRKHE